MARNPQLAAWLVAHRAQIDRILCDMNGQRYRGNEYGFAALRFKDLFRDAADFEAPADCWGEGMPLSASTTSMITMIPP